MANVTLPDLIVQVSSPEDPSALTFTPATLQVDLGDPNTSNTVTWTFSPGGEPHNAISAVGDSCETVSKADRVIDSPNTFGGGNYTTTFDAIGEYPYICSIGTHCESGMKGVIKVIDSTQGPSPAEGSDSGDESTSAAKKTSIGWLVIVCTMIITNILC